MTPIFHLLTPTAWDAAVAAGRYEPPSLGTEGFVHFSFAEQVAGTANLLYRDLPDLLLAEVDPDRLDAEIRVEDTVGGGTEFPHVYGAVPLSAVVGVRAMERDADGHWTVGG